MVGKRQYVIEVPLGSKIYFASDQHFGSPTLKKSIERERKFISWLDEIKGDCTALFLLGDLFDFWFEYKQVVPRGYIRVLGKLAEFTDAGIPIYFFVGNHDLWMRDYLEKELSVIVFREPAEFLINGKLFLIGHGDGLGPGDYGYKFLKKVFTNPIAKFLYYLLHPDLSLWLGKTLSEKNKLLSGKEEDKFMGEQKEWLLQYAQGKLKENKEYKYFIFGHRHLPIEYRIEGAIYFNTGDWIKHFTYGFFDGEEFYLKSYHV